METTLNNFCRTVRLLIKMPDTTQDILVEIPDDDLPKLLDMYEKHKNWAPYVYSIILTGIEWRRKRKEKYTIFLSPNNCWKQDGTFFVLLTHYSFFLFFFSLDDCGKNIYHGIKETKRLDAEFSKGKGLWLYTIHRKFYPIVMKAAREKGLRTIMEDHCHMFSIPKEEALKFDMECPSEVYIKKLDKSHANFINSLWPHRYENLEKYLELLIEMNDAYGVFLESSNELVSWILLSMKGQLCVLQTAEGYRGKGYASLITKYMSKQLALKGYNPFGTVLDTNHSSICMFRKIGFKSSGIIIYSYQLK